MQEAAMMWYCSSILCASLVLVMALRSTQAAAAQEPAASAPAQPAKELRVAAVQMRSGKDLDANVKNTIEFISRCAKDGVRVVVFPECSVTGYRGDALKSVTAEQLTAAEQGIAEACKQHKVYAVGERQAVQLGGHPLARGQGH
jgi:hypothetical protein